MFEKLKNHLKKHSRAYSLGFLALVAVCVSYLYVQVDELENEQMTGWIGRFTPTQITTRTTSPVFTRPTDLGGQADFNTIQGLLTITASQPPESAIAVAGTDDMLVAKYVARATNKSAIIKKLTVINDSAGAFTSPENTSAVEQVWLSYNGKKVASPLANGKATFSDLNINVPRNGTVALDIYADVPAMGQVGETLSGKKFRLGLSETQNVTETNVIDGSNTVIKPTFKNSDTINSFVVRKTKPAFERMMGLSSALVNNTENDLYAFTVSADPAGSVGLGRLVFEMKVGGFESVNDDIRLFKLYRGSSLMSHTQYNIVCAMPAPMGPTNVKQFGMNVCDNDDSVGVKNGTYQIIVSFNNEESIAAGSSQMYKLNAYVSGYGSITTGLANGDDNTPLTGLKFTNPNMGKIFSLGTVASGIFFRDASEFRDMIKPARNIIWSDKSADLHIFPTAQNALLQSGSGSYDWTNGYLLKLGDMPAHTISY